MAYIRINLYYTLIIIILLTYHHIIINTQPLIPLAQNTLFLFILFYTNKYNIFTHSPIMKAVSLIDDCLCERIEFLESLLIISSYQDIVAPIPKKLQEESDQLTDK